MTPGSITPQDIAQLIGDKPNPVIIEVGCNDGEHTRMFLDLFERPTVFCFEPDARARVRFHEAMVHFSSSQTKPHASARMYPVAVGAVDGTIPFYPSYADGVIQPLKEWDCSGSIRRPKEHLRRYPWCMFRDPIEVPITRLDTWRDAEGHFEVFDFLWADVQGAEGDLIAGGPETLSHTRYFYTEYCNRELYDGQANLAQILAALPDFEIVTQYPDDVLLRNRRWK